MLKLQTGTFSMGCKIFDQMKCTSDGGEQQMTFLQNTNRRLKEHNADIYVRSYTYIDS